MALTYDARRGTASSSERNIFRTWMICHNLDAITALVFDRPSLFGSIPRELKRWPTNPDSSPESIVGVLTTPLQHIDAHIKKQSFDKILYGADLIPAIVSPYQRQRRTELTDSFRDKEKAQSAPGDWTLN